MDQPVKLAAAEYADISIVGMLRTIRQNWILFSAFVVVCAASSVAYAFLATPYYKSSTLLSSASSQTVNAGFFGQVLGGFGLGGLTNRQARNSRAVGLAHTRAIMIGPFQDQDLATEIRKPTGDGKAQRRLDEGLRSRAGHHRGDDSGGDGASLARARGRRTFILCPFICPLIY